MVSVERVHQYLDIKPEGDWTRKQICALQTGTNNKRKFFLRKNIPNFMRLMKKRRTLETKPLLGPEEKKLYTMDYAVLKKPEWPTKGQIEFVNYCLRYRPGLPLALDNLNLHIKGGEKFGVVGRTGAGKTSITLGLFRLIEASSGKIFIDSIDISTLGLHELRRQLMIIPQDAALFSGTLRQNFDPADEYSDNEIWTALEHSQLKNYVKGLPGGLESKIEDGGANMSVGQRQLICLTRALLRRSKILILDEATAFIDHESDKLIQKTIRSHFAHCTVITIAHRLETILDYDSVAVLSNGRLVESGRVTDLLLDKSSEFRKLVTRAGMHTAQ